MSDQKKGVSPSNLLLIFLLILSSLFFYQCGKGNNGALQSAYQKIEHLENIVTECHNEKSELQQVLNTCEKEKFREAIKSFLEKALEQFE